MSSLAKRIAVLAASLSPQTAKAALDGLRTDWRSEGLAVLDQTKRLNRLQWRQVVAENLGPSNDRRDEVLSAARHLAPRLKALLDQPRPDANAPLPTSLPDRLLERLVRECGG